MNITITSIKKILIVLAILILLIVAIFGLYQIINNSSEKKQNQQEGFDSDIPKLGNLIAYSDRKGELKRPLPNVEGRNIIRLASPIKLTGFHFKVTGNSNNYRLFIGTSLEEISNPRTRKPVVIPSETKGLVFNKMYNDMADFEKTNGDIIYTGSFLAIEMLEGDTSWPEITEYQIFGLNVVAPSLAEYRSYIPLADPTFKYGKSTTDSNSPDNVLNVTLKNNKNQMVGKITVNNYSFENKYSPQLRIRFRNDLDAGNTSLFSVNGPIRDQFINIPNAPNWDIYLDRPIMANYLELTFTGSDNKPIPASRNVDGYNEPTTVSIFGYTPTTRDINNYKLQGGIPNTQSQINIGGTKCPPTAEMLNKQVQAQLICEALEYKDREKNKRLAFERDKLYLQKLKTQDEQIRGLENEIKKLINRKNDLAGKTIGTNIDELEKELKAAETARRQAEEYLKNKDLARDGLRLKFNLDPQFQQLLGSGPTTEPTPS